MFAGLLDSHEIALAGQSDGGVTVAAIAANSCCTDPRIAAVAVVSGSVWPPIAGRYFSHEDRADAVQPGQRRHDQSARLQCHHVPGRPGQARYYLDLSGASHTEPYWGRNRFERIVARVTLAFFDRYVLGQREGRAGDPAARHGARAGQYFRERPRQADRAVLQYLTDSGLAWDQPQGEGTTLQPMPEDWDSAVAVVAHPDDLEYGAASAVARWTRQGKKVSYLLATRGEAGIAGMAPAEVGPLRVAEEQRSAAVVGVSDVRFLDFADGLVEYGIPLRRDWRPRSVACVPR